MKVQANTHKKAMSKSFMRPQCGCPYKALGLYGHNSSSLPEQRLSSSWLPVWKGRIRDGKALESAFDDEVIWASITKYGHFAGHKSAFAKHGHINVVAAGHPIPD
jgi:hypothetical protein